jgi:hypothetical protein
MCFSGECTAAKLADKFLNPFSVIMSDIDIGIAVVQDVGSDI